MPPSAAVVGAGVLGLSTAHALAGRRVPGHRPRAARRGHPAGVVARSVADLPHQLPRSRLRAARPDGHRGVGPAGRPAPADPRRAARDRRRRRRTTPRRWPPAASRSSGSSPRRQRPGSPRRGSASRRCSPPTPGRCAPTSRCSGCAATSTSARATASPTRTALEADVVCVCAGGWLGQLFELPLRVQLEQVAYVAAPEPRPSLIDHGGGAVPGVYYGTDNARRGVQDRRGRRTAALRSTSTAPTARSTQRGPGAAADVAGRDHPRPGRPARSAPSPASTP